MPTQKQLEDALILMYLSEKEKDKFNGDYIYEKAEEHNISTPVITDGVQEELKRRGLINYPSVNKFMTQKGKETAKEYIRQRPEF